MIYFFAFQKIREHAITIIMFPQTSVFYCFSIIIIVILLDRYIDEKFTEIAGAYGKNSLFHSYFIDFVFDL